MTKRLASAAVTIAAAGAAAMALAPTALAAPNGGLCTLSGTATFNNPLTAGPTASPFTYTFTGALTNCHAGNSGGPESGAPSSGTIFTPAASNGSGSCVSSTTSGIAVIKWSSGTTTVESYSTSGVAAAVAVTGTIIPSTTVPGPNNTSTTYTTNEPSTPVGDSGGGVLSFSPPSPTDCTTGVNSAAINGAIGTGNDQ